MLKHPYMKNAQQSGFTLLEVLVALLILSIGLLGLAALQTVSLQFNTGSYARTQATLVAYEIIERMRANPTATKAGLYDVPTTAVAAAKKGDMTSCLGAACDSSNMAKYDLGQWYRRMVVLLPDSGGQDPTKLATIERDTTPTSPTFNSVTITIKWRENEVDKQQKWIVQL